MLSQQQEDEQNVDIMEVSLNINEFWRGYNVHTSL